MSLPTPVPKNNQKIRKPETWDRNKKLRENYESAIALSTTLTPLLFQHAGSDNSFVPSKSALLSDYIPFLPLLPSTSKSLPQHVQTLIKELAVYPPPESLNLQGQVLDEQETEVDGTQPMEESFVSGAQEMEIDAPMEEPAQSGLLLSDDDIEDW